MLTDLESTLLDGFVFGAVGADRCKAVLGSLITYAKQSIDHTTDWEDVLKVILEVNKICGTAETKSKKKKR